MHIIENIIPKRWQEDLLKYVQHLPFTNSQNTSYQQYINGEPSSFISGYDYLIDENTVDTPQFVHTSIFTGVHSPDTSISYSEFRPLLYMMQENLNKRITAVSRVKVNCLLKNQNMKKMSPVLQKTIVLYMVSYWHMVYLQRKTVVLMWSNQSMVK